MAKNTGNVGKKSLLHFMAAFVAVVLVTTFATLWFSAAATSDKTEGNVDVEYRAYGRLSIESLSLNGEDVSSKLSESADFVFDSAVGDENGRVRWDGVSGENLTVTVSGTVVNAYELKELYYSVSLPEGIIKAAESGYVDIADYYDFEERKSKNIKLTYVPSDILVGQDGIARLDFSFEITLGWGEYFNGDNPSIYYDTVYYDGEGRPDESAGAYISDEEMLLTLDELRKILSDEQQNYKIVITATDD